MPALSYLLLLMVALATGLGAAVVVVQKSPAEPRAFDRPFLTHVLFLNLLILGGIAFRLVLTQAVDLPAAVPLIVLTLLAALKLGWVAAFTRAASALRRPGEPGPLSGTTRNAAAALFLCYAAVTWPAWFLSWNLVLQSAVVALEVLVLSAAAVAALKVLQASRRLPPGSRRRSLQFFGAYHLALLALLLPLLAAGWLRFGLSDGQQDWASGIILLLFNLFPLIWIHAFGGAEAKPPARRMAELGITPRERQIIGLIAVGKTNREIASELFISEATVKDHNHNLFRKCGVRNRVELASLFRNTT